MRGGQDGWSALSSASFSAKSKCGRVCTPAGTTRTERRRLPEAAFSRRVISGSVSRPWPRASRFWISEVMNTVLPARLRPVTARRMVVSFSWPSSAAVVPRTRLRAPVTAWPIRSLGMARP